METRDLYTEHFACTKTCQRRTNKTGRNQVCMGSMCEYWQWHDDEQEYDRKGYCKLIKIKEK